MSVLKKVTLQGLLDVEDFDGAKLTDSGGARATILKSMTSGTSAAQAYMTFKMVSNPVDDDTWQLHTALSSGSPAAYTGLIRFKDTPVLDTSVKDIQIGSTVGDTWTSLKTALQSGSLNDATGMNAAQNRWAFTFDDANKIVTCTAGSSFVGSAGNATFGMGSPFTHDNLYMTLNNDSLSLPPELSLAGRLLVDGGTVFVNGPINQYLFASNGSDGAPGVESITTILSSVPYNNAREASVVRLYDKNNVVVGLYRNNQASMSIVLRCTKAQDISSDNFPSSGIDWNVASDKFSTGKLEIEIFGFLSNTQLQASISDGISTEYAKNGTLSEGGRVKYSIPFKVEAV